MKTILYIYNTYEREKYIIRFISDEIKNTGNRIVPVSLYQDDFWVIVEAIKPSIIFTYPITTSDQKRIYRMLKIMFSCSIIVFATEGFINYKDKDVINLQIGEYEYDDSLVDYYIYWGPKIAGVMQDALLKRGRISSKDQVLCIGYPMYETSKMSLIEKEIEDPCHDLDTYKYEKNILVLTGFATSAYEIENIYEAQDLVDINMPKNEFLINKDVEKWRHLFYEEAVFRDEYIKLIIETAQIMKDYTFNIKLHPLEITMLEWKRRQVRYIDLLRGIPNIRIIDESIPLGVLLKYSSALVHYGSTASLEAHIYKVPAILVYDDKLGEMNRLLFNSSPEFSHFVDKSLESLALSKTLYTALNSKVNFKNYEKIEEYLYDTMNYVEGKPYIPSRMIARFLAGDIACGMICPQDGEIDEIGYIRRSIRKKEVKETKSIEKDYNHIIRKNRILRRWIDAKILGRGIAQYLIEKRFKSCAIYGRGEIGLLVAYELKEDGFDFKYFIDKNSDSIYSDDIILKPGEDLPYVDVVIVSVISDDCDLDVLRKEMSLDKKTVLIDIYSIIKKV